eukprot:6457945-Amphidinium_carterae.2
MADIMITFKPLEERLAPDARNHDNASRTWVKPTALAEVSNLFLPHVPDRDAPCCRMPKTSLPECSAACSAGHSTTTSFAMSSARKTP